MLKVYRRRLCVPNSSTIMVHVIQSVQRAEFKVQSTCNTISTEGRVQSTVGCVFSCSACLYGTMNCVSIFFACAMIF